LGGWDLKFQRKSKKVKLGGQIKEAGGERGGGPPFIGENRGAPWGVFPRNLGGSDPGFVQRKKRKKMVGIFGKDCY